MPTTLDMSLFGKVLLINMMNRRVGKQTNGEVKGQWRGKRPVEGKKTSGWGKGQWRGGVPVEGIDKEGPIGEGRRSNWGGGEGLSGRKEGPIKEGSRPIREGSRANQGGEGG